MWEHVNWSTLIRTKKKKKKVSKINQPRYFVSNAEKRLLGPQRV